MVVKAAGLVIYRKMAGKIEYLLLRASYGTHHWTSPKGHVEIFEDERSAALREVQEESGYRPENYTIHDNFEKILEYEANGKKKRVTYWIAQLKDPEQKVKLSHEHNRYKWISFPDVLELVEYDTARELFHACNQFITEQNTILF